MIIRDGTGRLCGVLDLVKLAVLTLVKKSLLENWQLLVSLETPEALLGFEHACGCPAQGHLGIPSPLHVPADLSDNAVHRLDDVGAGQ
jgi:hypothetical protein